MEQILDCEMFMFRDLLQSCCFQAGWRPGDLADRCNADKSESLNYNLLAVRLGAS